MAKKDNDCPVPSGILVLIGGKENKGEEKPEEKEKPQNFVRLEILKAFVDLINKKNPVIEVITSASSDAEELFDDYRKVFEELGIKEIGHIHHTIRREVLEDSLLERLKKANGVFFAGGDQLKYTYLYGGTSFLTFLKQRYINDNIVIAGTSAGAMCLSTPMIYAGNAEKQELGGEIRITTGLEFMRDVCIDTHFVHRGRFVRMAQVIATNPTCIGMGIEEDTAVVVRNGVEGQVIGTGIIIVIEGFGIAETNIEDFNNKKPLTIRDLKVHILSCDDTYIIPQINPPHK